jgi:hypothetical protein
MSTQPADLVRCHPDPARLGPFRDLVVPNQYLSDPYFGQSGIPDTGYGMGNVWTRAVAYSCGHLTRDDAPLDHLHDPAELAICERTANEVVSRLSRFVVAEGGPIGPFVAAAVAGEPVSEAIDEAAVRRAFGGTLAPGLHFKIDRMARHDGHWNALSCVWIEPDSMPPEVVEMEDVLDHLTAAWDEFADWFVAVPGLREHTVIGCGSSDADPGVLKPQLLLALTPAGSLVGVISYVAHA